MSTKLFTDPFTGVKIFMAAVEEGSFTKAASRLGLSKSAIGKSLQRLEGRLGTELFQRSSKGVHLTADGEHYYTRCKVAYEELKQGEIEICLKNNEPVGTVHIDMPASYGRKVVMPILIKQMLLHQGLNLEITFNDQVIDPMPGNNHLSIRFGEIKSTNEIVSKFIRNENMFICSSPQYISSFGKPGTIDELKKHRCLVGLSHYSSPRWLVRGSDAENIYFAPVNTHQIGDGEAILEAAKSSCGICHLPEFMVRPGIENGELIPILSNYQTYTPINLLWPTTCRLPRRVRHIIDVLKENLS